MTPPDTCAWPNLMGYGLVAIALLALPRPPLRVDRKSIGYWPLLGLTVAGAIAATTIRPLSGLVPLGYEIAAIGVYFLLRHYGNERADNAAWLWLVGSQGAGLLLLLMVGFGLPPSYGWLLLLLLLPIWPFSFWWGETLSQSPLPVGLLVFTIAVLVPYHPFPHGSATAISPIQSTDFGWVVTGAAISLLIYALALGRQSDLKLSFAFLLGFGALLIMISHHPLLVRGIEPVSLLLPMAALALLIGHLQKTGGSTQVEDFGPLATHPQLHRFRRCWTLACALVVGVPVLMLGSQLLTWETPWRVGFLLAALVLLAGSLFHLRARLFYGDAHTRSVVAARDLPWTTYLLVLALLMAALVLALTGGLAPHGAR